MTTDKETRRFLVLLSVSPATPTRLQILVPRLREILEKVSVAPIEQLFRSLGADHFGFLVCSRMPAALIHSIIESPQKDFLGIGKFEHPPLTREDHLAVIEIGADFRCGEGFTRAGTWLQRN